MKHHDFLFELFTEELPPKALKALSLSLKNAIESGLIEAELIFENIAAYATPRRLAIKVNKLAEAQPTQKIERKGPAITQAYDTDGKPTQACLGFAKSCGIALKDINSISTIKSDKGEWLYFQGEKTGSSVIELIPEIIKKALKQLPIPKPMYWGEHKEAFARPVHAVTLLYGEKIIDTELFDIKSNRVTHGHRFMSKHPSITLSFPEEYETQLEQQGFVIADFEKRKQVILEKIENLVQEKFNGSASVVMNPDLLDEVTALVEWPNVLICDFDQDFLAVPKEALISSMQDHQKCFAIIDNQTKKLLPHFITVSNLISKDVSQVIHGNECVMRARLSDAKFFYETDLQIALSNRVDNLKTITYQEKLGSVFDKAQRVKNLVRALTNAENNINLNINSGNIQRAAELCKADLVSHMVGEFPELQGIMGEYYALNDKEDEVVAIAIREHYQPRNASDNLPETDHGILLAIADRMDTLAGIFAINKLPTGDKDPFALRRAAVGILKIILEKNLNLNLNLLINLSIRQFDKAIIENKTLEQDLLQFFYDRLKALLLEQDISHDVFQSVIQLNITQAADALKRMKAVQAFKNLAEAEALTNINKRVNNLLNKTQSNIIHQSINIDLFEKPIEQKLYSAILEKAENTKLLLTETSYTELLKSLADLKPLTDVFFEEVMIMAEDENLRNNRLILLTQLRKLFLQVADIAELQ